MDIDPCAWKVPASQAQEGGLYQKVGCSLRPLPLRRKSRQGGFLIPYNPGEHSYSNPNPGELTSLQLRKGHPPDRGGNSLPALIATTRDKFLPKSRKRRRGWGGSQAFEMLIE